MNQSPQPAGILSARGVILSRGGRPFARLPDIAIAAGRSAAIVGPSGCGKTTALMALAGIRAPHEGAIVIDGIDPWTLSRPARDRFRGRRMGLVFQSFHLVDALSVAANIRLAGRCAGVSAPGRSGELLTSLGLADIGHERADRISHGQAQRVAVARALFNRPAVVLGDEPTSALDDANTGAMLDLLARSAGAEGAALVIATHDRRVLAKIDQIIEMEALP